MPKIIWIPPLPTKNIYPPMYKALAKQNKTLNLTMVVVEAGRSHKQENPYFKLIYMPCKDYGKIVMFPAMIINKLLGYKNYDIAFTIWMKGLYKTLKEEKPDLVISNLEFTLYTMQAAHFCKKNNIPFIVQTETQRLDSKYNRFLFKIYSFLFRNLIFEQPKIITAWTTDGLEYSRKIFPVKDRSKIVLLPAPVDTKLFYPTKVKKDNGSVENCFVMK